MKTPNSECPTCHTVLSQAAGLTEDSLDDNIEVHEGDLSICAYCGEVGIYNANLRIEKIPNSEMLTIFRENPELLYQVIRVKRAISTVAAQRAEFMAKNN